MGLLFTGVLVLFILALLDMRLVLVRLLMRLVQTTHKVPTALRMQLMQGAQHMQQVQLKLLIQQAQDSLYMQQVQTML